MDRRLSRLIDSLPTLTQNDVDIHDICSICCVEFATILENVDSEGSAGLTRLARCGHVFCRKDLVQWIRNRHGSCPICRSVFLSNDEEYLPEDIESLESPEEGLGDGPNGNDEEATARLPELFSAWSNSYTGFSQAHDNTTASQLERISRHNSQAYAEALAQAAEAETRMKAELDGSDAEEATEVLAVEAMEVLADAAEEVARVCAETDAGTAEIILAEYFAACATWRAKYAAFRLCDRPIGLGA